MNERIRALADEANIGLKNQYLNFDEGLMLYSEKFAELIVKECLNIVDDAERGGSNEIWDNAVKFIRKDLKEHFGVEQ